MPPFVILLLVIVFLPACIWLLHRNQRRRQQETAERAAPLTSLDAAAVPDFALEAPALENASLLDALVEAEGDSNVDAAGGDVGVAAPADDAQGGDNWPGRIRALRESGQLVEALRLCETCFPRIQAFQQAAIVLRQQIREELDRSQPVELQLRWLYNLAALADLFRTGNPLKPVDPEQAFAAVRDHDFDYTTLGYQRLKLLTKGDIRALEQLWGRPRGHRHAEDVLGSQWATLCQAGER